MKRTKKVKLTIEFDNDEAMMHFASWLCGSGEQKYWQWMEYREMEEDGPITAVSFDYHKDGEFLGDDTIRTTCGRMDEEDEWHEPEEN